MTPTSDFALLTEREFRAMCTRADRAAWPFMAGFFACWVGAMMILEYFPGSPVGGALVLVGLVCPFIGLWPMIALYPRCPACRCKLRAEVMRTRCCVRCKHIVLQQRLTTPAARKRRRRLVENVKLNELARWYCIALAACGLGSIAFFTLGMMGAMLGLFGTVMWGWVWLRTLRARFALPFFCGLIALAIVAWVGYQKWP